MGDGNIQIHLREDNNMNKIFDEIQSLLTKSKISGDLIKDPKYSGNGIRVYQVLGKSNHWVIVGFGPLHIISEDKVNNENPAKRALLFYLGYLKYVNLSNKSKC